MLFAMGVAQVVLLGGIAHAAGASFFDGFDTFDGSRWTKTEHDLGRSHLNPANVDVVDGNARLKIPGRTLQGAELRSNELYYHGTYSTRMKLPQAPSSITGFFLYRPPDHEREIDVELFNDSSRRVMFTTYSRGRQTHTVTKQLPFDPTADYHTYAFRYDEGLARFMVDGNVMQTWKTGVPKGSMYLYTNVWFPNWLEGRRPLLDSYLYVDWIRFTG
ncbi:MAG TPA: glycoside hydrolase family 16 protein [Rubrobacter sp.]|nr:glycoside hydrolase family 16 protein [Rubrobacter sp.]